MIRAVFSLVLALGLLVGPRLARAECSHACEIHEVDAQCEEVSRTLPGGTAVDLVASCSATCVDAGAVARGTVSPTTVPVTATTGEYGGALEATIRTCGASPVFRWSVPAESGAYLIGGARFVVRGVARAPLYVAVAPTETVAPPAPPRDWEDRKGFALELGFGPVGALIDRQAYAGGDVVVGLHSVRDEIPAEHGEKFSWPEVKGLRWCAPIGCGMPLLILFAPADSLIGNDRGVDLHAEILSGADGSPMVRVGVQPIMRYSRGFARTGTFLGTLLPELAFITGGGRSDALGFAWSVYPVDFLVDRRHLAIGFEPLRAGFRIPLDGSPVAGEMRTAITFRWVR